MKRCKRVDQNFKKDNCFQLKAPPSNHYLQVPNIYTALACPMLLTIVIPIDFLESVVNIIVSKLKLSESQDWIQP